MFLTNVMIFRMVMDHHLENQASSQIMRRMTAQNALTSTNVPVVRCHHPPKNLLVLTNVMIFRMVMDHHLENQASSQVVRRMAAQTTLTNARVVRCHHHPKNH